MPVQTFNNLEIDTHDFKLKLSLHIGNLEIIKNHIHNDTLNIYLRTNRLFNSEFIIFVCINHADINK